MFQIAGGIILAVLIIWMAPAILGLAALLIALAIQIGIIVYLYSEPEAIKGLMALLLLDVARA